MNCITNKTIAVSHFLTTPCNDKIRGHYFAKLDPLQINLLNLDQEGAWIKKYNFGNANQCLDLTPEN